MITVPFLDLTVPKDQYYNEALDLGQSIALKTIGIEEALSGEFQNIVISDQCLSLVERINSKNKYLWIIEPPSINFQNYQIAFNLKNKVNLIFSHTKEFLDQVPNSHYCPWGSYFIKPEHHKIYEKNANTTMIASSKTFTVGHRMRHDIIKLYENKIDNIRRGGTSHSKYQNVGDEYKLNFISNYRFSIEVENHPIEGYFTEKILDCFRTGTIPIYNGDPKISDHFNDEGILKFSNIEELSDILNNSTEELYLSKINAVKDNFNKAEKYLYPWKFIIKEITK